MNVLDHTIYIVPIEPLEARYTKQWYENIPTQLCHKSETDGSKIVTIDGEQVTTDTTQGGFLDFATTNWYKSSQVIDISRRFLNKLIKPGDVFLVTDAWNPVITAIRYMSELLDVPVEIHGIWHAGAYDPTDILGMKMSKPWPWHQERAYFYACDYNYFATNFHANMFKTNLGIPPEHHSRIVVCGQPHEQLVQEIQGVYVGGLGRKNQIIWPHRFNSDKQPDIAEDLSEQMTNVGWYFSQKERLGKLAYYQELSLSKILFSCSLHENLGISVMEGCVYGVIPVLPDRASYSEMYLPEFLYPSEWTSSYENYLTHRTDLINFINRRLDYLSDYHELVQTQKQILLDKYLNANVMYDKLLKRS